MDVLNGGSRTLEPCAPEAVPTRRAPRPTGGTVASVSSPGDGVLLEPFTDTSLYSLGAYFADRHPDLLEDVIAQAEAIEQAGLDRYAQTEDIPLESAFQTLVTGLAVRYFKAVAGGP